MFRLLYVDPRIHELPGGDDVGSGSELHIRFASNVEEALAQAAQCDVVMVSATIPEDGAVGIVRAVAQARPDVRVLVKDLAESRRSAAPFIEAGAVGWLL